MVDARRREEPGRILCDTSQSPIPEYARQAGQIRLRTGIPTNGSG